VRCVTVLEAFAATRANEVMLRRLEGLEADPGLTPVARGMVEWLRETQLEAATQWGGAVRLWNDAYQTDINASGSPKLKEVRATRHAIVHSGGVFTRSYRRQAKARLERARIDPARATGLIPIDGDDVADAFAAAETFVLWLDTKP
jgi:hypothetical protein